MNILKWLLGLSSTDEVRPASVSCTIRSEPKGEAGAIELVRRPIDLASMIETALRPLMAQAHTLEIALILRFEESFPKVIDCDGLKLTWAVTSVVGNALRFVRRGFRGRVGGTIRVTGQRESENGPVSITIADDGRGMPAHVCRDLLSRDFHPERVPSLGLLLVEDIVLAHGGTLSISTATSGSDQGTTVKLSFPRQA